MFLFIARYEWLSLKSNKLAFLLAAIVSFVLLFALYEGSQRVGFQHQTLKRIAQQEKADYQKYRQQISAAKQGQHFDGGHFGDPTNPFYFGNRMGAKYAMLHPAPLAVVSSGQSDVHPYYYKLTLSKKQALYHNEELENPRILFNGRFDVSFVIIFLLPLLIAGFTYNVFASEKEGGTLVLLKSQNTSVEKLVAYRFLFRYLLFTGFFSLLLVSGLLLFAIDLEAAGWPLSATLFLTWLYTGFWFALSYWINSLQKSSGFAATALAGTWLLLVLVVPTLVHAFTDTIHPLPSRLDLITKTRNVSDSIAKTKSTLSRFLEEHPEFKPVQADPKDRNPATLRNRIEVEIIMEKERADFAEVLQKREHLINSYRFFSPALFFQQALNKTAGTDEHRYKKFEAEVTGYQRTFRNYFAPLVYRQEKFTAAHLDKVPVFSPMDSQPLLLTDAAFVTDVVFLTLITGILLIIATFQWRKKKTYSGALPPVAKGIWSKKKAAYKKPVF